MYLWKDKGTSKEAIFVDTMDYFFDNYCYEDSKEGFLNEIQEEGFTTKVSDYADSLTDLPLKNIETSLTVFAKWINKANEVYWRPADIHSEIQQGQALAYQELLNQTIKAFIDNK